MADKGGAMNPTTEMNRQIVAEGLRKKATLRQQKEAEQEDARRKMFVLINANHEDACNLLSKAIEEAEKKRATDEVREALKASREKTRKEMYKYFVEMDKSLNRIYAALGALAVTYALYAFDGIRLWVAIPAALIAGAVIVWELVKDLNRAGFIPAAHEEKEDWYE